MTIQHHILEGALRILNKHRDANEVAAAAAPEPAQKEEKPQKMDVTPSLPEAPAAIVIGDDKQSRRDRGEVVSSSTGNATQDRGTQSATSAGTERGGGAGGETSVQDQQRQRGGNGGGGEAAELAAQPEHQPQTYDAPQPVVVDQPVLSQKDELEAVREAARGASETAKDSEIKRIADDRQPTPEQTNSGGVWMPPELSALQSTDIPYNATPQDRQARIDALGGEIPQWAKGDPENDPKLIRILEQQAAQTSNQRDTQNDTQTSRQVETPQVSHDVRNQDAKQVQEVSSLLTGEVRLRDAGGDIVSSDIASKIARGFEPQSLPAEVTPQVTSEVTKQQPPTRSPGRDLER